ncbi:hypothetical protein AKI39_22840 [Bordetella sp. H567]|uniref:hypothetical protein n=1 Tax=Bordetella sp. H567 TaxID=1697043 RepID=UPI00081CFC0C|nr:hypothetical protein [Bordetella sp. H567]AOB32972.1 hypothetical protein AKI39_22840 [Bordetella sp. H567]
MTRTHTTDTPLHAYLATPVGEQVCIHLDRRAAIRRAVPLLPRRLADLLALWHRPGATTDAMTGCDRAGRGERLASQTK